jgi:Flp pilus assembly protein TadD
LKTAIASGLPGADAHLELALCQVEARQLAQAEATLRAAADVEPGNPVVLANLGMVLSDEGRHTDGITPLRRALEIDPEFHEARFNLARVLARGGRRDEARREAADLLTRLAPDAPQRTEVQRLLSTIDRLKD